MNNILTLKGHFDHRPNTSSFGPINLSKGKCVKSSHLRTLSSQLQDILEFWAHHREIAGALVSVHYKHVVAKSNRLRILLSNNSQSPTASIRGAKFVWEPDKDGNLIQKHVFTHYISLSALQKSIDLLSKAADIIDAGYSGEIKAENTEKINTQGNYIYNDFLSKSVFLKVVLDGLYTESFGIDRVSDEIKEESIVTIFKTDVDTKQLLQKFGINIFDDRIIDDTTLRLNPTELELLLNHAPYLIAMDVKNFAELAKDDILQIEADEELTADEQIPPPNNEPIVGVIDTQFNEKVYFHKWVDYRNMLDPNIPLKNSDFYHGTEVTSIIVDGSHGNPNLDDGCGRFRVRHFGVATDGPMSSFSVLKLIRQIVSTNRDIKVWNLSLGSTMEIKENFISPEAAELDRIQCEYDVLFVVAGTNRPTNKEKKTMKIGSPADSLNSLVVNSVDFRKKSASYTRVGPVLSFFNKPDVSYYGGDGPNYYDKIVACKDDLGAVYVSGTSFAAPWVTRKIAYLVYNMGLTREIAKALIIDAAAGWKCKGDPSHAIGYGVVPIHISDILHSNDDEIRFIMSGTTESFETYTYNLPVPIVKNAHPFYARATLVYFPQCNRSQGVDYTNTEMDIHFGRVVSKNGKASIASIDANRQSDDGLNIIYEEDARKMYRKWDNVKHISDVIKSRAIPRKAYDSGLWGLSIKTKERMQTTPQKTLPFGVVVTLKEMSGVNRIEDFKRLCMARGWLVSELNVQNQLDIYLRAEENLDLE